MPTATYDLIEEQILGSATATMTLGNGGTIPQTYKDLVLEVVARSAYANLTNDVSLYVNGVSTGTSYSYTRLFGDGTSPYSDRAANQAIVGTIGGTAGATAAANIFSTHTVHLMSYTNTNINKTMLVRGSYAPGGGNGLASLAMMVLYRSTSAITSITISMAGGFNIAAGTTVRLWGIA